MRAAPARRRRPQTPAAFTLLELLVVLAILSLLAATSLLLLKGPIQAARLRSAQSRLRLLDAQSRRSAEQGRETHLIIDLEQGRAGLEFDRLAGTMYPLPIREIRLLGRRITNGQTEILYAKDGSSPSFAIGWPPPFEGEWTVICGGTGHFLSLEDTSDAVLDQVL